MNKKTIIGVFVLTLLSIIFTLLTIASRPDISAFRTDTLLFSNTVNNISKVNNITINTDYGSIKLRYDGQFWRLPQFADYYADFVHYDNLVKSLKNAQIENFVTKNQENMGLSFTGKKNESQYFPIEIITRANNEVLDDYIIGADQDNYNYVKNQHNEKIYLVKDVLYLPLKPNQWLENNLLSFTSEDIQAILTKSAGKDILLTKKQFTKKFYNKSGQEVPLQNWLTCLHNLTFLDVKQYDKTSLKQEFPRQTTVIFLENGLVYALEIYKLNQDFWMRINLSNQNLSTTEASDYIKNNSFLYEGWIFKISPEIALKLLKH